MTSHTFNILLNTIYLLVIVVLCAMIHRPYDELDGLFKEHYKRDEQSKKEEIKNRISYMDWHMHEPGQYEKARYFYGAMIYVDSTTRATITYLNDNEAKPLVPDSLKQELEQYISSILAQLPQDSATFAPYIDNGMRRDFAFTDKPNWANNILRNQPISKQHLIFDMLRSDVYFAETMVMKRLTELGKYRGGCGYDTMAAPIFSPNHLFNLGEKAHASFAVATLSKYVQTECYSGNRLLKKGPTIGRLWTDTAHDVGDYNISGFLRWYKYPGDPTLSNWDTLPWSFQYRVIAKGASIIRVTNQVCYRNVSNPLSVAIPGYAPDKIRLWAKCATVVNNDDGKGAIIITNKTADNVIVYADATDKRGHTATVHAMKFAVSDLPAPKLTINGQQTTSVTVAELTKHPALSAQAADEDWPDIYTVTSYDACLIAADGQLVGEYKIKGNSLGGGNTLFAEACKHLAARARIYLSHIGARTNAGINVSLAPVGLLVE